MPYTSKKVSIVIPTFNEEANITPLVKRINRSLRYHSIEYEVVLIDDYSTDKTVSVVRRLALKYPIQLFFKKGIKGKAQSLLEGFSYTQNNLIVMIDADLQYPPEYIPEMVDSIYKGYDIIIANRRHRDAGLVRIITSKLFQFYYSQILHGLDFDTQSGLKIFKKQVLDDLNLNPSPWTFDMEFLLKARKKGFNISSIDVPFYKRFAGHSKIGLRGFFEVQVVALKLKFLK